MKEDFEAEKRRLRQELDELKVQLALGKADAADYMEEKKEELSRFVDETTNNLQKSGEPLSEKLVTVRSKLDELKVQLALGRMESAEAYQAQKEKIESALLEADRHLDALQDSSISDLQRIKSSFNDHTESFLTKLEAGALNLGAGVMLATDETKSFLHSITGKLQNAASMTAEEAREARSYVRERIRKHRG